ncbi:MAG: aspartate aminotransferase family protein [Candidatus Rokubacteria bacterium]|nr:aspartate aminotransferase family protein [Candidatus Rokubacteria bacterium]
MAKVSLRESYRRDDIDHVLHGVTIPSNLAKALNRIFVEAYGVRLVDSDGKEYIDGMSSVVCASLGYGNRELAEAARSQMTKLHLVPSFGNRTSPPEIDLARTLADTAPGGIDRFMFTSSGSDSNESAIKIVRWYWRQKGLDKYKIISLQNAYHGATYGAGSASSFPDYTHKDFGPNLPGFTQVPSPYCYRCPFGKSYPNCGIQCAEALDHKIQEEGEDTVGAFLAEPAQSAAGVLVPPPEYWPRVAEICQEHDVLLIIDEVITGVGRMGRMWACEHWDIRPDILVFSKGIASGYMPISGVGVTDEIYQGMTSSDAAFPHVYTYNGHPVSCAVALKNLEILSREKLIDRGAEMGLYAQERLTHFQEQSPYVGDIRGRGLNFGIELVADKETRQLFPPERKIVMSVGAQLLEKGIIIGGSGNNIRLAPPLIITKDEIDYVLDGLEWAIQGIQA